jgi:hypothetical protein
MATNLQEVGRKFQDLAARSLQEQVRAAQRFNGLMQKLGRGELLKQPAGDAYLRFVGEETAQYVGNVSSLILNYYKELFELGRSYNEKLFEQVVGGATASGGAATSETSTREAPTAVSHRRVDVELNGTVGEAATRSFVLESKRAEATEISFLVSDFVGLQGTGSFRADLEFEPARFTLNPGEERVVTIRLPLSSDLFLPGLRYSATALVRGYDDLELHINVVPDAPITTAAQDTQPPAPTATPI